jgi:ABC-type sugar transport system substrate-binding protein
MDMTRPRWAPGLGILLLCCGCDTETVPAPSKSAAVLDPAANSAREIHVVLPDSNPAAKEVWNRAARLEAGEVKAFYVPHECQPGQQAGAIRVAVAQGARVLIVIPGDPAAIASTVAEIRSEGVPIVILGEPLPEGSPSAQIPTVTWGDLTEAAKRFLGGAREYAKQFGTPDDSQAIILKNNGGDSTATARVAALEAALKDAGIPLAGVVSFDRTIDSATAEATKAAQADPKINYILTEDEQGLDGAVKARDRLNASQRKVVVAGFCFYGDMKPAVSTGKIAAAAQLSSRTLMRRACRLAVQLLNDPAAQVPERTEVPFSNETSIPSQEQMLKKMQERHSGEQGQAQPKAPEE